jgi:2-oxoglutarate ferredoxin oxidoreductase subunit gamma
MHHELIIAGFGGQGVILAGQILAWAANLDGNHVVWSPSYGPEMRGGTAYCTVIISSEAIGSPVVAQPDIAIIMDEPSLQKFLPQLRPGGLLILNSSIVKSEVTRTDLTCLKFEANRIAEKVGDTRSANVVMLGILFGLVSLVSEEHLQAALRERWGKQPKLLELNQRALQAGMEESLHGKNEKTIPA